MHRGEDTAVLTCVSVKAFPFLSVALEGAMVQTHHQVQCEAIWSLALGTVFLWVGWTIPPAFPATALAIHDSGDTRILEPGPVASAHTASLFSRLAGWLEWPDSKFQVPWLQFQEQTQPDWNDCRVPHERPCDNCGSLNTDNTIKAQPELS